MTQDRSQEELAQLHREAEETLKQYPGVVGVGYGYKEREGTTTQQLSFRIYVVEKKQRSELSPEELIPPDYKGIPTDVIQVPEVEKIHCEDMNIYSPLISGITISNLKETGGNVGVGTLGCFATINGVAEIQNVVLISNHHVLISNGVQVGDTVYQPKRVEVGGQVAVDLGNKNPIGEINDAGLEANYQYTYQGESALNYFIDCATAKLNICISSWCNTNCGVSYKNEVRILNIGGNSRIANVGRVKQSDLTAGSDYVVYKVGSRTSRTVGKVVDANGVTTNGTNVIVIDATQNDCEGLLRFVDEGDSGSALINSQNQIVGLVYAKSASDSKRAYACHIHPVLDKLKVTAITAANPPVPPAGQVLVNAPGAIVEERINYTPILREKFLSTEKGRKIAVIVEVNRNEVVHLVNHRRPVTVAWHRNQGPAFLSHLIENVRNPEHPVPQEIEGVSREILLKNIAQALMTHGSPALRKMIEHHLPEALAYVDQLDNLHEFVEHLNELQPV